MSLTKQLIYGIRSIETAKLSDEVLSLSRDIVRDGIGVTLAGYSEPSGLSRIMGAYVSEQNDTPQATIFGLGRRTSAVNAAFVNGTFAHALDFDNTWFPMNHPTSPTLPAILALAEAHHLSGGRCVTALVAAFEMQARLRIASVGMPTGEGFHKPGTIGIFGATVAAIVLLELNDLEAAHALGIAGSRAGSLSANTGTMTKSSHAGHAARMGVESAMLAKRGFTANPDIFGPGGYFETFVGSNHASNLLVDDFGRPLHMIDVGVGFKKYPCNYFTHRAIDAALKLSARIEISSAEIAEIGIRMADFSYIDRSNPDSGLDGKFSVQYVTCCAVLDGRVDIDSFTDERRFREDITNLLSVTRMERDPSVTTSFLATYVELRIRFRDGSEVFERTDELPGMPGVPLTPEDLQAKFTYCAGRVLEPEVSTALASLCDHFDEVSDVGEIAQVVWNR